ncbi:hypothetical protein PPERSA_08025 [Pseudocohnilembus persalinus]|uniref:RNA ligase domain-containing protein n=1 Tax=Pseudocohnilembus persalinus TaxID=266149 RepID=A0A0V0R316_PSEPJ|nr:hypothetical protein PPERSA_08025 [Pseudocohnilembus persalinus]|eukprot:KRX08714.1 hypothetical protein PPERSA_08025 [Pseudocohnilembus persalinus]
MEEHNNDNNFIFNKYSSIENLNTKPYEKMMDYFQEQLKLQNLTVDDLEWVMSEKIHGANFSFLIKKDKQNQDNLLIQCASRNGILQPGQNFNNYEILLEKLEKQLYQFFDQVEKINKAKGYITIQVQIFGEIYGGFYQHQNVQKIPKRSKVQKGVYYSPDIEFQAFDCKVTKYQENQLKNETNQYMSFKELEEFCNKTDFPFIGILKKGKFKELIKFNADQFESQVYLKFNLPKIENNIAEGVVLRPYNFGHEPLIKIKSEKYKEKSVLKQEQEREFSNYLDENKDIKQKFQEILQFLNENRLNSVLSKLTDDFKKRKNSVKIAKLLIKDAKEDFAKEASENQQFLENYDEEYLIKQKNSKQIQKDEKNNNFIKQLKAVLNKNASELVTFYFEQLELEQQK